MPRSLPAAILACVAFGVVCDAVALPGDPTPTPPPAAPPTSPADPLLQQESEARAKAAAEMADVAKFCAGKSAYDEARQALLKAIDFSPQDAALATELDKIKNKKDLRRAGVVAQIDVRRNKGLAKCTELVSPVALAFAQANRSDDLARIDSLLRVVGAPPMTLDVAFFEPYLELRTKEDVEKLQAGWELVDGSWLEPTKVAELDAAHAAWTDPWIVSDDVHEVRTNLPMRTARQVLRHAAATRRVFLRYFAGEWDLRPPASKLPVFVTQTRAELDERVHAECPTAPPVPHDALAYYADSPAAGNPCFVCFESLDAKDKATKLDFKGVGRSLAHEIDRQVAFEYSKHAPGKGRIVRGALWAIEGVAEFLPYVDVSNGACVVTHPSWIPSRGKEIDGAFAWCHSYVDKIPAIDEFIGLPRQKFLKSYDNCRIAATLALFLLEGNQRAYRAGFVKFLEQVHQDRDGSDALAECLPSLKLIALDAEFRTFCQAIRVDEK